MAEYINNIGDGLDAAVENSLKKRKNADGTDHKRFSRSENTADFHHQLR